ncbi:MAG: hypothetical protein H9W81_15495 [Enterococcus sp.]|nr:hypothetical protein [Enterococcus sp.]
MTPKSGHKKRARAFVGQRNYYFETHDINGEVTSDISEEAWKEQVREELLATEPYELVFIFHDKDIDKDGSLKTLHCHLIVSYEHPRSAERTRELLKVEPRHFKKLRKRDAGAYRYLTHTTEQAMNDLKYRYSVEELNVYIATGNGFEKLKGEEIWQFYSQKIAKVGNVDNKSEIEDSIADILYDLADGKYIENWDIKDDLIENFGKTDGVLYFTKYKKQFESARDEFYQKKFRDWKEHGRKFQSIYIDGPSGIGKTTLANKLARRLNKENGRLESLIHDAPNASFGTRFDFVQDYQNELVTIFDDLDPRTFSYEEFLNLFESDKVFRANSRFENKPWFAEYAIITKSQPLAEWTKELSSKPLRAIRDIKSEDYSNCLWQPRRRINLEVQLEYDKVSFWTYKKVNAQTTSHRRVLLNRIPFLGSSVLENEELQNQIIDYIIQALN